MTPTRTRGRVPSAAASTIPTDFLSPAQVADVLGIARTNLYALISRGHIAHHRVGKLIRFREHDVAGYLSRTRVEARPPRPYVRYPEA